MFLMTRAEQVCCLPEKCRGGVLCTPSSLLLEDATAGECHSEIPFLLGNCIQSLCQSLNIKHA